MSFFRLACVIGSLVFASDAGAWQSSTAESIVAVVDGRAVTFAELEARLGDKLLRLKSEEYTFRLAVLNQYVEELLLTREAARRGSSVAELLQTEVTNRVPLVTRAEARAVVENAPRAELASPNDQAVDAAMTSLQRRRAAIQQAQFVAGLRQQYRVEIKLEVPRLSRGVSGGYSLGPDAAPVSILAFTDFQCPYCATLNASLQRIQKESASTVRITVKQFPLPNHPQAAAAAEAAFCAADQGKYWEMHRALFSEQGLVTQGDFFEIAKQAGLAPELFETCFNNHKGRLAIAQERLDAVSLGINSTPTLFINGLMLVGAKPYEALREIINSELKRLQAGVQGTDDIGRK